MSDDETLDPWSQGNKGFARRGLRKDGKPIKEGNTREDGSYEVGRDRPPPEHRFGVNDGRKRGRRPKGVRNFDTEYREESQRQFSFDEAGKKRTASKRLATIVRTFDNAISRGKERSISLIFEQERRLADREAVKEQRLPQSDQEIIEQFLSEQAASHAAPASLPKPVDEADSQHEGQPRDEDHLDTRHNEEDS